MKESAVLDRIAHSVTDRWGQSTDELGAPSPKRLVEDHREERAVGSPREMFRLEAI